MIGIRFSYLRTLRDSESASQALTAAIMRRLKGQLAADDVAENEVMKKICEGLGALL
jgi:hypothetical protein